MTTLSWYEGLDALAWEAYSEGTLDQPQHDADYLESLAEGPVLDVGCGAGRFLLRQLRRGVDIEGVDASAEMLGACRRIAERHGLEPTLHHAPMQDLDLPRRFRTIFVPCGSLMCVPDRADAQRALDAFHRHLLPGGRLIFNVYLPRYSYDGGHDNGPQETEWRPNSETTIAAGRLVVDQRRVAFDLIEQTETWEKRFRLYEADDLVREEVRRDVTCWYFKHELELMLEKAGFERVERDPSYPDRYSLLMVANRSETPS